MGKHRGRATKRNHTVDETETPETLNAPHSFVIHRGLPFPNITYLTRDFRRMMEPFTASSLRERRKNRIKDFVSLSGMFHVSHMVIFNKTTNQLSFRMARLPKGPTLTFKIHQFTLARDVLASMKKQYFNDIAFKHSPLVILNNFTGEGNHMKLMAHTFQNMFPTINLATVNLASIKRCVLFSYNPVTQLVDMRHFAVTVAPVGLNRSIKRMAIGKVPNLAKCEDIADFISQSGNVSDSEYEDDETNEVILPQTLKRGNFENNKSAIRLHEIGPRLTIELTKIQDDLFRGDVLYHNTIIKSEEELLEIKKAREEKKRLKDSRKRTQNENVAKKAAQKDAHKKKSLVNKSQGDDNPNEVEVMDDDAEYYRKEVGEEPDEDLFHKTTIEGGRKRAFVPKPMKHAKNKATDAKRRKTDDDDKPSGGPKTKSAANGMQKGHKGGEGDGGKFKNKSKPDDGKAAKKKPKIVKKKKSKGKKNRNKNK